MSELADLRLIVMHETSAAFAVVWSMPLRDASVARITSGGQPMYKLFHLIGAATRDARRAESLMVDSRSRRTLRVDPEATLLAFELRAGAIGDESGEREARIVRRDRGVRAARRNAAVS